MIRSFACVALLLIFSIPAQAQPTIMDLIEQAKANNAALSQKVDATQAKVDALGAAFNAQAAQMAQMQAKMDKIHVLLVAQQSGTTTTLVQPAPAVLVTPPSRTMAIQTPGQQMMFSSSMGMGAGACASGSCGSGSGNVRVMRFRR